MRLQSLREWTNQVVIAFGNDGCFAEGPAQVGIAEFGAAQPLDLAGAGDGAFDQAAVGDEVLHRGGSG